MLVDADSTHLTPLMPSVKEFPSKYYRQCLCLSVFTHEDTLALQWYANTET